jgi:small subunit ribosomal protein S6
MKTYEVMFIVVPNAADEEIDKVVGNMETAVRGAQGEVLSVDKIGKRKLAYRVGKFEEGYYVLLNIKATGEVVKELERRLRVTDSVLRYITVRVDQALKRVDKIKAARLKKLKKKSAKSQPETTAPQSDTDGNRVSGAV